MDATILYHPELPLTNMLMDEVGEKLFLKRLTTIPGIYTNYFRYKDIIISLLQSTAGLMPLLSHATFYHTRFWAIRIHLLAAILRKSLLHLACHMLIFVDILITCHLQRNVSL